MAEIERQLYSIRCSNMIDQGRSDWRTNSALWLTVAGLMAVGILAVRTATAEPQSAFERLENLDRRMRHHDVVADSLAESLRRSAREAGVRVGGDDATGRAREKLERRATRRLTTWEQIHRRITRQAPFWSVGGARDLRHLLEGPERRSLSSVSDLFATIRKLRARLVEPTTLLRRRAELTVELAQHRASGDAARVEKEKVVESARGEETERLEDQLDQSQRKLEESLEERIEHETGEDFHRRKGTLLPPVSDDPSHAFGTRKQDDSMTYVRHTGLTYGVESGSRVRATAEGIVVFAERLAGYGNLVIVDHGDGYHSLYAHLSEMSVEVGEELDRGGAIGVSGATDSLDGPKLYFELRHDERPIDPKPWFVQRK